MFPVMTGLFLFSGRCLGKSTGGKSGQGDVQSARILGVARTRFLANELPDPSGRQRPHGHITSKPHGSPQLPLVGDYLSLITVDQRMTECVLSARQLSWKAMGNGDNDVGPLCARKKKEVDSTFSSILHLQSIDSCCCCSLFR